MRGTGEGFKSNQQIVINVISLVGPNIFLTVPNVKYLCFLFQLLSLLG
uniref:Uncharacterized protein n=1 Tax=Arundo donax TaxID=35708 RepID=A0A0A8Y7Z8_ARUDO